MSIPTDEISDEEQAELRDALRHGVFGRLTESIRDRMVRTLHRCGLDAIRTRIFRQLLDPMPNASRFADLTEPQQTRLIDTLYATTSLVHAEAMRRAVDAIVAARLSSSVQDAAVNVASAPVVIGAALPAAEQRLAWWWLSAGYRHQAGAIAVILRHASFGRLDDTQRSQLFDVLSHIHSDGTDNLLQLLEAAPGRLHSSAGDGHTPLLLSTDAHGHTMLAALHSIATGAPHASLGIGYSIHLQDAPPPPPRVRGRGASRTEPKRQLAPFNGRDPNCMTPALVRARALADLVGELAWPDQSINQDTRWTCQVTCILHRLATIQPAEYARLAAELVLTAQATLRNGDTAEPPPDAREHDGSTRSVSERLLQSSFMAYARAEERTSRGEVIRYENVRSTSPWRSGRPPDAFNDGAEGLKAPPVTRVFNAVLPCTPVRMIIGKQLSARLVRAHFALHPNEPMIVGVSGHVIDLLRIVEPSPADASVRPPDGRHDPPPEPGVYYWNPWGAAFFIDDGTGHLVAVHDMTVDAPRAQIAADDWVMRSTVSERAAVQRMSWRTFAQHVTDIQQPTDEP